MFTHGNGSNGHLHRESEIMWRVKSLSSHIRDPDKVPNLWKDIIEDDHTRTTLKKNITKENLFLNMFPNAPKILKRNEIQGLGRAQSTGNLLKRTYWNGSKLRTLNSSRKSKLIKPAKYYLGIFYEL